MNSINLSVVVPIYNGQDYVKNILDDLHIQSLETVEFILVDDGSIDRTAEIVQKFINNTEDSRFKYLYQVNNGVSSARNFGINNAVGKYIMFIDADDSIGKNMCATYLQKILENGTDIEFFPFQTVKRLCHKINALPYFFLVERQLDYGKFASSSILSNSQILDLIFDYKIQGYPFGYISKISLWRKVKFDINIFLAEDLLALAQILVYNDQLKIHINKTGKYLYIMRENSALHTTTLTKNKQILEVSKKIVKICAENGYDKRHANNLVYGHYFDFIKQAVVTQNNHYYSELRSKIMSEFLSTKMPIKSRIKRSIILILCIPNTMILYKTVLHLRKRKK